MKMNLHYLCNKSGICISLLILLFGAISSIAQTRITGQVKDDKGNPLIYGSVSIENTIDGATTDSTGKFSFKTSAKGKQVLVVSYVGYETKKDTIIIDKKILQHNMTIKENAVAMQEVVVTAGAFAANDDQKVAILKPLDIYTNAGAGGDIMGAIRSLPGAQAQSYQTGLFVRGGDASETEVIVDGMTVQNPFSSNVPGVSQRSRFTPFQFKGISFSSGGYSARYGQALSSVLELNTMDLPDNSNANFSLGLTGVEASGTKKWNSSAAEFTGHYENLSPFFSLAKTNIQFYDIPTGGGFSTKYTMLGTKKDLLKIFLKYETSSSGTYISNAFSPEITRKDTNATVPFGLKNNNLYFNSSYNHLFNKLLLRTMISASNNDDGISWQSVAASNKDWRVEGRGEGLYSFSDKFNLLGGIEFQHYRYVESFDTLNSNFKESLVAGYFEAEWKPKKWFSLKPGIRIEHSALLNESSIAPRLALALGTGQYSQISMATGLYYQDPDKKYLFAGYRPKFQEAIHYIANYQHMENDRTFRIEGYYKTYSQLVRERLADTIPYNANTYRFIYNEKVDNSGNGYAAGVDIFWRDKSTLKNFDYWISYSYTDTKRLYENFKSKAIPSFVSKNNLNVLLKYFIEPLQVNLGLSYTYASGRPFYNPSFMETKSPDYQDLAFSVSYLVTLGRFFGVAYASIDNITGHKNILGYNYSIDGSKSDPIKPAIDRYFYIGFTIALTRFNKEEL